MDDGAYVDGSVWFYDPNKIAPIVFAAVFGASGSLHTWQCCHYKSWKLTGSVVFGAAVYCASFIARALGAYDYTDRTKYIVHFNLVYMAPPIFELVNHGILARVAYYLPYYCPIHPGRLYTSSMTLSGIIECLGGYGAYYTSNRTLPKSDQDIGRGCLIASLLMQIAVLLASVTLAAMFHARTRRGTIRSRDVENVLWTLYASSTLILIRTVFRVVEYFGLVAFKYGPGFDPDAVRPVVRFEWYFYVFEASIMLCNQLLLHVRHPCRYLPENNKLYLAQDGMTEIEGPGVKDNRPIVLILMDPLDFIGLIKGTNKSVRFWADNGFSEVDSNTVLHGRRHS